MTNTANLIIQFLDVHGVRHGDCKTVADLLGRVKYAMMPTMDNTAAELQTFLYMHGIKYPASATKAELLALMPVTMMINPADAIQNQNAADTANSTPEPESQEVS